MAKADKNVFTIADISKQVSLNVRTNREIHVMNDQRIYNKNKISVPYVSHSGKNLYLIMKEEGPLYIATIRNTNNTTT